jgi:hypothetical protein
MQRRQRLNRLRYDPTDWEPIFRENQRRQEGETHNRVDDQQNNNETIF